MHKLIEMLSWRRPHATKSERQFVATHVAPLGVLTDGIGNVFKRVGHAPRIMFSCHVDTVHRRQGRQTVRINNHGRAYTMDKQSSCLGADDTAGVWLLSEMIEADIPGLYVFHRGEELGGIGSRHAASVGKLSQGIKACIAFDRRGYRDVITHQGARTCSDKFARSLSGLIGMGYRPSDAGMFTDSANYVDVIGECTNVSVGYDREHWQTESLDCYHLQRLRDRVLALDWNRLRFSRKPRDPDPDWLDWYARNTRTDKFGNVTVGHNRVWSQATGKLYGPEEQLLSAESEDWLNSTTSATGRRIRF